LTNFLQHKNQFLPNQKHKLKKFGRGRTAFHIFIHFFSFRVWLFFATGRFGPQGAKNMPLIRLLVKIKRYEALWRAIFFELCCGSFLIMPGDCWRFGQQKKQEKIAGEEANNEAN